MNGVARTSLLFIGIAFWPAPGQAEPKNAQFITDDANLFHAPTVVKAREKIQEIRRLFHRDVFVETIVRLDQEDRKRVKAMRRKDAAAYFADLGEKHAQASEVDGILILICRDPKYVQVTVWPESQKQTFSDADAERLRKLLVHRRYSSGFDQALLDGLDMITSTYQHNLHLNHPDDGPANGWSMAVVIGGCLIAWCGLMLASARFGGARVKGSAGPHPGLLGAMFGQLASTWIYDRLFPPPPPGTSLPTFTDFSVPVTAPTRPAEPTFVSLPEGKDSRQSGPVSSTPGT